METKEISLQVSETRPDPNVKFKTVKIGKIQTVVLEEGENEEEVSKKLFEKLKREVSEQF